MAAAPRDEVNAAARVARLPEDPWGIASETSERPVARRGVLVATVGQLVLAAAVTGALLGRAFVAGDGAPAVPHAAASPTIAHGGLRLQVPSDWARGQAAAVPGFSRPLRLKNTRERLSALVERLPASSASLLPARSRRRDRARATAARSSASDAGQPAWRYRRRAPENGSATLLYAAPDDQRRRHRGLCGPRATPASRAAARRSRRRSRCPARCRSSLGRASAFYTRLPAAAKALEAARSTDARSRRRDEREAGRRRPPTGSSARTSARLAALAPLTGTRAHLPSATVRALSTMAGAYATLAGAARARSPRRYNAARRAVARADADLRRTLAKAAAAATAASQAPTDAGRRVP